VSTGPSTLDFGLFSTRRMIFASGPRTDALGRALGTDGKVIPGLYAAGNAGGAPTKGFYGGAGGTISLGLVFGHLAGREAARQTRAAQHGLKASPEMRLTRS
jgi:succinate dehydrogenase/fumarate reductase flavoprotein subunit